MNTGGPPGNAMGVDVGAVASASRRTIVGISYGRVEAFTRKRVL